MKKPLLNSDVADLAPAGPTLTMYDEEHMLTLLRCHFPLRRGAVGARLIAACGPRHLKVESHEETGRKAGRVVDLSFSHLWRAARAKPGSHMPTPCGRMVTRRRFLANEAESKSSAGFCRDGLQAAREARGARRGDPRCPDNIFGRAPVRTGQAFMTKSPTRSSLNLRRAECRGCSPGAPRRRRLLWPCRKMLQPIVPTAASTFCFSGGARSNKVLRDKAGLRFARRCRWADTSAKVSAAPPWSMPIVSYRKT
jgi:hypothetical protein